ASRKPRIRRPATPASSRRRSEHGARERRGQRLASRRAREVTMQRILLGAVAIALGVALGGAARAEEKRCPGNRSKQGAMWLSIAHPGLGEDFLKGWGSWRNMPQKKFWYGFIPLYGWPRSP